MCQLEKICIKSVQVNKGVEKMVIIYSCGKLHFSDRDCYEIEAELTVDETSALMQKIWPHKCGLIGQKNVTPGTPSRVIITDLHLHPPHSITRLISIINTGLVSLSLLKPSSSTLPTLFLWQRAERLHRDPLWESQQCKWLLMASNGRGAWAVYCCFDKLSMTCVVWGQSECKTTECWEKNDWWWWR